MTQRPQNRCGSCGYTWYPRGKDLSRKCPRCGGGDVGFVPTPPEGSENLILLGIVVALALITLVGSFVAYFPGTALALVVLLGAFAAGAAYFHRRAKEAARLKYLAALESLLADPASDDLRERAVALGRDYLWHVTLFAKSSPTFSLTMLAHDIHAACGVVPDECVTVPDAAIQVRCRYCHFENAGAATACGQCGSPI